MGNTGDNTFFCLWERGKNGNFVLDVSIEVLSHCSAALIQCCHGHQYFLLQTALSDRPLQHLSHAGTKQTVFFSNYFAI